MNSNKNKVAYCFSPSIMVATCEIELSLIVLNLIRYKLNKLNILATLLLVLLALFQLSEFRVCRGSSAVDIWSHIGYVSITLLPVIGIHIINVIRKNKDNRLVYAGYLISAAFVLYFVLTSNSLTGHACLGNYVIFQVNSKLSWLYGLYYYGFVIFGLTYSYIFARRNKNKKIRIALYAFSAGYASFLIPTTTVNLLNRSTLQGIPSIMCGFAVILALILSFFVMPNVGIKRFKK